MSVARSFFTPLFAACLVFTLELHSTPVSSTKVAKTIGLMRRDLLVNSASIAKKIAKSPDDSSFGMFIKFAIDTGLIGQAELAKLARRGPIAVSRWVNGHSYPDAFIQEVVLNKMAEEFETEVAQLSKKWKSPAPSSTCAEILGD
jgi:hypothetical protein